MADVRVESSSSSSSSTSSDSNSDSDDLAISVAGAGAGTGADFGLDRQGMGSSGEVQVHDDERGSGRRKHTGDGELGGEPGGEGEGEAQYLSASVKATMESYRELSGMGSALFDIEALYFSVDCAHAHRHHTLIPGDGSGPGLHGHGGASRAVLTNGTCYLY